MNSSVFKLFKWRLSRRPWHSVRSPCSSRRGAHSAQYAVQDIRGRGADRFLFLSSSAIIRTPDWFLLRDFADVGPAHLQPELLPPAKFAAVDPAASCRLFVKEIVAPDATSARVPAGKRIGF